MEHYAHPLIFAERDVGTALLKRRQLLPSIAILPLPPTFLSLILDQIWASFCAGVLLLN